MFETPAKRDIDYALSMLMHEARRQVADEKDRLTSEAIKHGAVQSNRVVVAIADAADKVHTACITQAKQILIDFVHRMERPATEITAWARPHLENLNNVVLAGIPPNGFPDDHQRIISQYQAAFQQRAEGTLREVEIGYVKGSGFSTDTAMSDNEEWVSAASAVALLGMQHFSGTRTICKRAHVGLIKARAQRFIHDERSADDVDVPVGFWWAEAARGACGRGGAHEECALPKEQRREDRWFSASEPHELSTRSGIRPWQGNRISIWIMVPTRHRGHSRRWVRVSAARKSRKSAG